ncbi:HEPN domain-containing protein [Candidatus Poribacteria bacterium]|nr:HEPN domain-containing protein [Candidatus Poribacteria bacterium]
MNRLMKAEQALVSAQRCLNEGDTDSCASRAYFGVYHALVGYFQTQNFKKAGDWNHETIHSRFVEEFVHRKKSFPADMDDLIRSVYVKRNLADYNDKSVLKKEAERSLNKAMEVVKRIKEAMTQ